MEYKDWELDVPEEIKSEPIWKFAGYCKALYLYDLIWDDTESWMKDVRGQKLADQIVRSSASMTSKLYCTAYLSPTKSSPSSSPNSPTKNPSKQNAKSPDSLNR